MAFATHTDIATRLATTLSSEEQAQATAFIEDATAVITEAAGEDDAWATALTPVPNVLKAITISLVLRAMASPQGLTSASESLGAYSRAEQYSREGMVLSPAEAALVAQAAGTGVSGSVRVHSLLHDVYVTEPEDVAA